MSKGHFILYDSNEKSFTSMGVLVLDNYIMNTCIKETMNENYTFEFEMFNSVAHLVGHRMYIKAPTRKGDELFRVRIIEKDMNNYGATYFYCTQIFFCDMEDNFIENLELTNLTGYAALDSMDTNTQYPHSFNFYSDVSVKNSTIITRKNFVSALIGDSEYSFVNTWGGELEVNKFDVKMMTKIGQDRGVRVRYRKNLTGLNVKTDYSSYCTRIMPIGYDDITIPEKYVDSEKIDPDHPIVRVVEFSNIKVKTNEEDEEGYATITEAENALREAARKLFTDGKLDEPESTYEVEFQELSSTLEYHDEYAILENIFLGDTVEVYHEDLGISVSTRCVSYEYDPKIDRYNTITLGNAISKFSSSSVKNQETILDKITNNDKDYQNKLDEAVEKLTGMINSGLDGHVLITENEIMIMDTTNKDTAVEVWRYNINGFGYSNSGYNGPFIGLTKDGKLLVTEATTNKFTAALINAGVLQSVDKSSWFNLDSGTFSWANGAIAYDGNELTIKVGDQKIDDLLDSTFNIVVNREHQIITLDTNSFPVNNGSYKFTFTVLKGNTTTTTPCKIISVTPSNYIDGVSFEFSNNTCTMIVDKTKRFLGVTEESFDVEIQILDYKLHKIITWSTILQGRDGLDGVNGTNGVSSYFHVKYAPDNNPTAGEMTDTPQEYIGTYVDNIPADSNDPSKYTWIKIQGSDGTSITIDYTVETLPNAGEIGKYYYVNSTGVLWRYEQTGWVELGKIQGPQGIPGTNGVDGHTQYLHIKYSNDGGETFTTNNGEDVGMYIGTYVDFTESDSIYVSAYKWARIKGSDGTSASYVKILESARIFAKPQGATDYSPSTIKLTPELTNCTFNKWQYSTNGGSSWTNVTSGLNGLTVANGVLTISNSSPLFTDSITSISFKVTASDGSSDVSTIVRLKDGVNGLDGTASNYNLVPNSYKMSDQYGVAGGFEGSMKIVADSDAACGYHVEVKCTTAGSGGSYFSVFPKSADKIGMVYTYSFWAKASKQLTLSEMGHECGGLVNSVQLTTSWQKFTHTWTFTNGTNDTFVFYTASNNPQWAVGNILYIKDFKIEEGDKATPWLPTVDELIGESAVNVILGNENHTFQATSDGKAIANTITFEVDGFVGTTEKEVTIGSISGVPTGMTVTASGSGTTNTYITVKVNTTMTDLNGIVNIPVTCNGLTFNKQFTYSLAVPGKDGEDGVNGTNGIDGTSSYFHIKYSPVPNPTSSQMTEAVNTYIGTYVDTSPIDSTDPSKYTWSKFIGQDGNNGANGTPGKDGKDGITYYLHIKYSNDGKTFTSNNGETPGDWLGQYVDTVEADSTVFSKYSWTKIRGDDGASASYVHITASSQVFLLEDKGGTYTPSSVKLTPTFTNAAYSKWQYSVNSGTSWTNVTSGANGLSISNGVLTVANTCNLYTDSVKSLQFKVIGTNDTSDTISIVRVQNGVDGTVSGFNMLQETNQGNKHWGWMLEKGGSTCTSEVIDGINCCKFTRDTTAHSGWNVIYYDWVDKSKFKHNTEYTVSFEILSSLELAPCQVRLCNGDYSNPICDNVQFTEINKSATGWVKLKATITTYSTYPDEAYPMVYMGGFRTDIGVTHIFRNLKIEEGTVATEWLPSVEELNGNDSVNVILGNENHTFVASSNGAAIASSTSTTVVGYVGTKQTACSIGTISGLPTGMTAAITNNGTNSASINFTVTTSLTTKNGIVTIPITCGGITVNKYFSYSLAVAGANGIDGINGVDGANGVNIRLNASTNIFKSTDGGITFKPDYIDLGVNYVNCEYGSWQYSTDGGTTWINIVDGSNGLYFLDRGIRIVCDSPLFNDTVTAITIRINSNFAEVYDTLTVYKLYDRVDINDAFEEMRLTVTQSDSKWEAAFRSSNANNLFKNSDAMTLNTDNWIDNGGGLYVAESHAFPFLGGEPHFGTTFPNGFRYGEDLLLLPDTDYVYEAYVYINADLAAREDSPLAISVWKGTNTEEADYFTIIDYNQTVSGGEFSKVYVHFKTDNVTDESLHGRFFIKGTDTVDLVAAKRLSLKIGVTETEWTQHPNEVKSSTTSIDADGVTVKHSDAGTFTQMTTKGFSINDTETGDVLAWLSSKSQWTEMKVDKVFANNIENVYEGSPYLYVNHSATVSGDGSAESPFNSFAQLKTHLEATPVINKDIFIVVRDPGFVINEQLYLERLKGVGIIDITLEDKVVIANAGYSNPCVRLVQMPEKWVWITGSREYGSATTGAVLQDGGDGDGFGIYAADIGRLEINNITIACTHYAIQTERVYLYTYQCDFGKCYLGVDLCRQSIYYSMQDVGSTTFFCNLHSGSFAYWGNAGSVRPMGPVQTTNGVYYDMGAKLTETASPRFPTSNPAPIAPSGQVFTYTYSWTSHRTYQYQWSNWNDDDCKQGSWGYGLRGGHMFFDLNSIRSNMTGTVQDGNTITLTRASSGGNSWGSNVYINGSTCSSASGTPSYGNQTHLGTLAWGETKTFTLPKAIVQGLVNGTYNSLAVYVNSSASSDYINIVNCSITLKTKK